MPHTPAAEMIYLRALSPLICITKTKSSALALARAAAVQQTSAASPAALTVYAN
jgi:hypothetical protein